MPVAEAWRAIGKRRVSGGMEARMGLMNALRNLFGAGAPGETAPAANAVEYHGYRITPAPQRQPSGWNTAT